MKKLLFIILVVCLLLTGCGNAKEVTEVTETIAETTFTEQAISASKIYPLPDTTMENLSDAILSISLEEGDAYVDDTGKMQIDVTIYTYDKYDMVDISILKVGDILVTHTEEVQITSLEHRETGALLINGGLDEGGIDLITDESGIFYACGYSDTKSWYKTGEATIRVSEDFTYRDTSDLDNGELLYYPGSFLTGEVTDYNFTPHNTTIRIENSQIIEMNRVYTP